MSRWRWVVQPPPAAFAAMVAVGAVLLLAVAGGIVPGWDADPVDARAYWLVDAADPYGEAPVGASDGYFYSPVFAQLVEPLGELPFDAFLVVWRALGIAALFAMGTGHLLVFPGAVEDLVRGNIHLLLALAIVIGFRFPGAWAAVLLTKVTPGIGLLWFVARGEWRALGLALAATGLLVLGSVLVGGIGPWMAWMDALVANAPGLRTYDYLGVAVPPLAIRLPLAAALVIWGARTDRRWVVPVAATLSLPVLWPSGFALLVAVPPLVRGAGKRPA